MKIKLSGIAVAALLTIGSTLAFADDTQAPSTAAPAAAPSTPAPAAVAPAPEPAQTAAPASVARPSIVPKTNEASQAPATAEPAPRRHRRYAHRHYRRYAYWEPFPIYWPHIGRHHFYWSRVSWFGF